MAGHLGFDFQGLEVVGGVLRNSDPFGQTEKGGGVEQKLDIFLGCHKCVVPEFIDRKNDVNFLSSSEQVVPNSRTAVDLTTFTPETLSRKLHSLL